MKMIFMGRKSYGAEMLKWSIEVLPKKDPQYFGRQIYCQRRRAA